MASSDSLFEEVCKMCRLAVMSDPDAEPTVKFREVFLDPNRMEGNAHSTSDEEEETDDEEKSDMFYSTDGQRLFVKDPMCPPGFVKEQELIDEKHRSEEAESPMKLGRNMRASRTVPGNKEQRGVLELMNLRKKLLQEQCEQHDQVKRQINSEKIAATLVNKMLREGYLLKLPDKVPQGEEVQNSRKQHNAVFSQDELEVFNGDDNVLMQAVQKEIQHVNGVEEVNPLLYPVNGVEEVNTLVYRESGVEEVNTLVYRESGVEEVNTLLQ